MKIEIRKQKRKTIALKVLDEENAILTVPLHMSEKNINEFLENKKTWLEKVVAKMKNRKLFAQNFQLDKYIYLGGKVVEDIDKVILGYNALNEEQKRKKLREYYCSIFSLLQEMTFKISAQTGIKFKELKILNSVRVWGSFNINKQIKLNWKLLLLPTELVEYVIYHELCHSLHMNHKPQFWKSVAKVCPNYKTLKKKLQQYSFVLKEKY